MNSGFLCWTLSLASLAVIERKGLTSCVRFTHIIDSFTRTATIAFVIKSLTEAHASNMNGNKTNVHKICQITALVLNYY